MTPAERRNLIDRYLAACNAPDVQGMAEGFHPKTAFRHVAGGKLSVVASGLEEFRALAEQSAAFSVEGRSVCECVRGRLRRITDSSKY